jgi:multiple sugar transport system substrate-binding protein
MKKNFLNILSIMILAVMILTACGGNAATTAAPATAAPATVAPKPAGPVTLVVMVNESDFSKDQQTAFTTANPNITIQRIDSDSTKLSAMIAAGTPPDLFQASGADTASFVKRGWVLDLAPYFAKSTVLKADDMVPAVSYFKDGSGWYGMNTDWSPDQSYFINKKLAEAAGITLPPEHTLITYAQAGEWAKKMTKVNGGRVEVTGMIYSGYWDANIQTILMEEGKDLYSEDFTHASIKDNQTVVDFLTFMADLAKSNAIYSPINPDPNWTVPDLLGGQAGSATSGYWIQGGFRDVTPAPVVDPNDLVMYPALSWGGKVTVNPGLGGNGWFISSKTTNPDAAWKLFEYFFGGEPAVNRAKTGWGLPSLLSLYSQIPTTQLFQAQFLEAAQWEAKNTIQTPRRVNPYYTTTVLNDTWNAELEKYLKGSETITQAIENLDAAVNKAIADGKAAAGG